MHVEYDWAEVSHAANYSGPSLGDDQAAFTIVMFNDIHNIFGSRVMGTMDQLLDEYLGKLRLVMKTISIKEAYDEATEALLFAEAEGRYWPLHHRLMAHREKLDRASILEHARVVGLSVETALDEGRFKAQVEADRAAFFAAGFRGVPAFIINDTNITGARPIEQYRTLIDEALAP